MDARLAEEQTPTRHRRQSAPAPSYRPHECLRRGAASAERCRTEARTERAGEATDAVDDRAAACVGIHTRKDPARGASTPRRHRHGRPAEHDAFDRCPCEPPRSDAQRADAHAAPTRLGEHARAWRFCWPSARRAQHRVQSWSRQPRDSQAVHRRGMPFVSLRERARFGERQLRRRASSGILVWAASPERTAVDGATIS